MGDGAQAAPLFYRYGTAAKTPLTRSKGFYWAGRAASRAGDRAGAQRYWEMAAEYPDWYYGQLALSELGRPMPTFANVPAASSLRKGWANIARRNDATSSHISAQKPIILSPVRS